MSTCTDGLALWQVLNPHPVHCAFRGGQSTRVIAAGWNPGLAPLPPRLASGI